MEMEPVIGLEVHAQLLTQSKIFCGCRTTFGQTPNTNVCPVCLGLPGALPVLNRQAVGLAVRAALALDCQIHPVSVFARKHYFYPDLPKGYQISQYEQPLATDGGLFIERQGQRRRVGVLRIHLEEDAGRSLHAGFSDSNLRTYVDFNRSGVPLVEIVTRPDLHSAAEAVEFFYRLRELVVAVGVSSGNMEEGSLRCDANVSVRPVGQAALGTKTEVKNLNSFRFLQRALQYEIDRQAEVLRQGGVVRQQTRLWDTVRGRTVVMRSKEEADDYRYLPEPDLPPLLVDSAWIEEIRRSLPELPEATRRRLMIQYGLSVQDVAQLTGSLCGAVGYFEEMVSGGAPPKVACHWMLGEIKRKLNQLATADAGVLRYRLPPARLARLVQLVEAGTISGSVAKGVFEQMYESGREAKDIVGSEGLSRIADREALQVLVRDTLQQAAGAVAQYRRGRTAVLGHLVGRVMKASRGRADPRLVHALLKSVLDDQR